MIAADAPSDTVREQRSTALRRLLVPRTIALVGLSDGNPSLRAILPTEQSDAVIHVVTPRHATALGRRTHASLSDIDGPVDAVMSLVSAQRTAAIAEEAADLDVGGLVLVAGGFAETGAEGAALQERIRAAAARGGMEVVGPNGLGYVNVPHRISLTLAGTHRRRPGGISVVSQSGAVLSGTAMAAWAYRGCGLNLLVSAGNEAVTDVAAYLDYLVDDPETTAIGLILEKVRRPEAFFAAVRRAAEAGKPVVAMKLARSDRTRAMAASHTGSLTGDAWVYDVALRQAGVELAHDPDELIDRLALFDQVPPARRSPVSRLAVVTMTGGFASLAADLAEQEGLEVPELEQFGPWVREHLPGVTVPNPLDVGPNGQHWPQIVDLYGTSDDVDAVLVVHPVSDEDEWQATRVVGELARMAATVDKPVVLASCSGVPGEWTDALNRGAVATGRGLRPTLRGLVSMGRFARFRSRLATAGAEVPPPLPAPAVEPLRVPEGLMLPFAAGMAVLNGAGIPTAPYHLFAVDAPVDPSAVGFAAPWVVKLADVAHRTEHDAVRVSVDADGLAAAVAELRAIARADGLPAAVAVQPMVRIEGEAFIGLQGATELGPLAAFGIGGVLVEALHRVSGRMAPFGPDEAQSMIDEFRDLRLMHGFRGRPAWDHGQLTRILVAAGALAAGGRHWIDSLDVNPLVWTGTHFVAVDALVLVRGPGV